MSEKVAKKVKEGLKSNKKKRAMSYSYDSFSVSNNALAGLESVLDSCKRTPR